ncbi:transcriptional repressor NF-X1 [Patella vulgata]|uniref:transcriptional repressor NF-X1 n=1 Tax=Patella vulgata TaxID=6465 RepID=UPI0021803E90|nr:transcriptional repressor NF-X1 [Patella vulgata]
MNNDYDDVDSFSLYFQPYSQIAPNNQAYTDYNPNYQNQGYYVPQNGLYQQQYGYDANYYSYYPSNQQFVSDPNVNSYVYNGAGNYGEYSNYQEQWSEGNQPSIPGQSKSYRNNRPRGRQNNRRNPTNTQYQETQATNGSKSDSRQAELGVNNGSSGAAGAEISSASSTSDDRTGLSGPNNASFSKESNERTYKPKTRWENSSYEKGRNRQTSNNKENNFSGHVTSQEYGGSTSSRQGNKRTYSASTSSKYDRGKSYEKQKDRHLEEAVEKFAQDAKDPKIKSKLNKNKPAKKKAVESSENVDQRTRMIDQLSKGRYECMVCCENMKADTAVWNCSSCFHLFHLFCIKKWARSSTALVEGGSSEGWRCPACQNITEKVPNQYRCFCGKIRDPIYNRYDTPHSCGDVCRKSRKGDCQHPCTLLCHPGACPPCSANVTKSCDCGQIKQTVRCGLNIGLKCDTVCGKKLNCGRHDCLVKCHSGQCHPCDQSVIQECYGHHTSRTALCGSIEDQEMSFCCLQPCNKILACGNHRCESLCHPGDCAACPLLPDQITKCPCGKTELKELSEETRTSCLAPVPTCDKPCKKQLKCGPQDRHHVCRKVCHEGECPPCEGSTKIKCRCKNVEKMFSCTKVAEYNELNPFLCDKRCTKKRLCGRHKCGDVCCVKDEHICEMKCNRKLNCGKHKCGTSCHSGNCLPCYEASFDELSCHCGSEVIFPPVSCGTRPPECTKVCRRQHDCDHKVRHNCHSEDKCPPCTELMSKMCVGGHELRRNIACHIKDIVCGYPCGRILPCGKHKCKQTCHKGECLSEGELCNQTCDIKREECGHPCASPCHPDKPCPKLPCKTEVTIKCDCGNRQGKILCQLGGEDNADIPDYQKISVVSWMNKGAVEMSQYKKGARRQLECDADCARLERNRRLALALEIENPDLQTKLGNQTYTDFIKDFARKNTEKAANIEKALYDLVNNAKQSKYPSRSHSFPAMNRDNRQFVHELAEFYGCETQSYDNEPKKNVVATAYK